MLNKLKYTIIYSFIFSIVLSSCTEKIDIDLDSDYVRLVVEATITDIPDNQYVKLSETADYFSNVPPKGIENAEVIISDGEQIFTLKQSDSIKGLYLFTENFIANQNKSYELNINLENAIGGHKEYSAKTIMPPLSDDIDSIAVVWEPRFEGWLVNLYAKDPPREDFYMFNGILNGILITDSIQKVNISDDRLFNGNYTNGTSVLYFQEDEINPGDIFTLVLSNVTSEYADFVTQVQTEIQGSNPLFSGPPANVTSNISNGAAGFFTAYPSALTSTKVKDKTDK